MKAGELKNYLINKRVRSTLMICSYSLILLVLVHLTLMHYYGLARAECGPNDSSLVFQSITPCSPPNLCSEAPVPVKTDKILTEEAAFKQKYRGVVKKWRTASGAQGNIPQLITGIDTRPTSDDPDTTAREFLKENNKFLKINTASLDKGHVSQSGGFKHIRYTQLYKGIPVENSRVMVHMRKNGRILSLEYVYEPALDKLDLTIVPDISNQLYFRTFE